MRKIIFALILAFIISCSDDAKPKTRTIVQYETAGTVDIISGTTDIITITEETEVIIYVEATPDLIAEDGTTDIIEGTTDIIQQEEKTMIAALFYDGSLKKLNEDYSIEVIQDAESVSRAGDYFLINSDAQTLDGLTTWQIANGAKKSIVYGGKLFYYTIDNKLYMCDIEGTSTLLYENKNNYDVSLTPHGIVIGFYFFFPDGSFEEGQYWAEDTAIKLEKIGSVWNKYFRDFTNSQWVQIGSGYYSDFVKGSALVLPDKIVFTRAASLLNNNNLIEPVYNTSTGLFTGGNAFLDVQSTFGMKPIFKAIGYIDNIGYFLCARDGKIYTYNISGDSLAPWVEIVQGTGNDDIIDSKALFEMASPVIVGNEIIFFDGAKIYRLNLSTGQKYEIAQATYFKGWAM